MDQIIPIPTIDNISEEIYSQIGEALYRYIQNDYRRMEPGEHKTGDPQVEFFDFYRMDAINCSACGSYYHKDGTPWFDFELEDGNWNPGFKRITEPEDLSIPKHYASIRYFVPDLYACDFRNDEAYQKAVKALETRIKTDPEFISKASGLNYDSYFEPTSKTNLYYREFATKNKLRIESKTIEVER